MPGKIFSEYFCNMPMNTILFTTLNLITPKFRNIKCLLIVLITFLYTIPGQAQLAAPNEKGVTFGHIHLNVSDIELHARLWPKVFGGALVKKEALTGIKIPGVLIFFRQGEPTAPSRETVIDNIGLKVRNIDVILSEWQTLGYEVGKTFVDADNIPHAYITMPNGTMLELVEDPKLKTKAELKHIHYATPKYQELVAWYTDLFGASPQPSGEHEKKAYIPGSMLRFSKSATDRKPTVNTAIDHIGFEVEDMEKFVETLQTKEVKIELGPRYIESIDLWILFFTDPGGARFEVTQGLDNY